MKRALLFCTLLAISACCPKLFKTDDPYFKGACDCKGNREQRIGAICRDETLSKSTGSGACSHHGGVKTWLCK